MFHRPGANEETLELLRGLLARLLSPPGEIGVECLELLQVRRWPHSRRNIEDHHPLVRRGESGPLGQSLSVRVAGPSEIDPILLDHAGQFDVLGPWLPPSD